MDAHALLVVEGHLQGLMEHFRALDGHLAIHKKTSSVNGKYKMYLLRRLLYLKSTVQYMESTVDLHVNEIISNSLMVLTTDH